MIDDELINIIEDGQGYVAILAGSYSDDKPKGDKPSHIEQIVESLEKFGIPFGVHIYSAHKQPGELDQLVGEYNCLDHPILLVAVAGGTDALSGTASWLSTHPVVSCPPDAPNDSCLTNPPGSSNAYIARPGNVGKFAAQMFSHLDPRYKADLEKFNGIKIKLLEEKGGVVSNKYLDRMLEEGF